MKFLGKILFSLIAVGLFGAVVAVAALLFVLYRFGADLPEFDQLNTYQPPVVTRVHAGDGQLLEEFARQKRVFVPVESIPPRLLNAFVASEDQNFFNHIGIDFRGIARAALSNVKAIGSGRRPEGASTITQQLAKNLFLAPERSIKRKAQEALLALWLELSYTKDEILAAYLNRVYLGAGTYGVDAASRTYFGKPARALDLRESALIAGLLKAPSRYAPTNNAALGWQRARTVLAAMKDAGYISEAEREAAANGRPRTRALPGSGEKYFADWVMEQVGGYVGKTDQDLIVRTSLSPRIQQAAERAIANAMAAQGRKRGAQQAAALVMSPDGSIRAMIGGVDYSQSH